MSLNAFFFVKLQSNGTNARNSPLTVKANGTMHFLVPSGSEASSLAALINGERKRVQSILLHLKLAPYTATL